MATITKTAKVIYETIRAVPNHRCTGLEPCHDNENEAFDMSNFIANTIPSGPDQRDIQFVPEIMPEDFKHSIDLMPDVDEVKDQLTLGSCVANGVVEACEMLAKKRGVSIDLSRMFLYTNALELEGRLGQEGLSPRDAYRAGHKFGIPLESLYPYDIAKAGVLAPADVFAAASAMKIERYEAVVPPHNPANLDRSQKVNLIKAAINQGISVGFAMEVNRTLIGLKGPWRTHNYQQCGPYTIDLGGHDMDAIGYDDSCGMFLAMNHWNSTWGDGGFCGLPYWIVDEPFFEAWLVRSFNGWEVPESPGVKLESINRYNIQARIVPEPSQVGATVNVWMGAMNGGKLYLRGAMNVWQPLVDNQYIPALAGFVLDDDNPIVIAENFDLSGLAGTDVYVAYGQSPLDWKLAKLCTIPSQF